MSNIIIKEACPEDAKELILYMKKIGGESDNLTYGADAMSLTIEDERKFLQGIKDDQRSVFYCAWKDEKIVGTGNISALPRRMHHRSELGISVVKAEWDSGIGSIIMEELIKYARKNNIEMINLEVRSDNARAIHLYKKYGFKHIGTSPAFFKIDSQYVDFELMYLDLR